MFQTDKEYIRIGLKTMMTSPTYKIPEVVIEGKRDVTDQGTVFDVTARCPSLEIKVSALKKKKTDYVRIVEWKN